LNIKGRFFFVLFSLCACSVPDAEAGKTFLLENDQLKLEEVAGNLNHPWGMVFLPDGRMLVTERVGRMRIVTQTGKVSEPLTGVPDVYGDQGGLLDVALSPLFAENHLIYFTYGERHGKKASTAIASAILTDNGLEDVRLVFRQTPKAANTIWHFGARLAFAYDGKLFATLGDNLQHRRYTQHLNNYLGKVVRLNPDGTEPDDNPFVKRKDIKPEIWSFGHRNPQGAAIHPETGELWISEHGPEGGDEINISRATRNYGWPERSYGSHYTHLPIADTHAKHGFEEPAYYWGKAVAPSGIAFYTGNQFPKWRGNLLVATLAGQRLIRLTLEGQKVVGEERLLAGFDKRLRHVIQGPDGYVYILTDEDEGQIIRIKPLH